MTESEAIREKRKFAIELKQLVHQKCVEINHYVSGCDSPFSYTQIADVQESLREIENTLNIKVKEWWRMKENVCITCEYYEKCNKPEREIKCMGYKEKEKENE